MCPNSLKYSEILSTDSQYSLYISILSTVTTLRLAWRRNKWNSTAVCDWLLTINWILQLSVIGYWQYAEFYNCLWLAIDNTQNSTTVRDWLLTIHWILQLSVIGYWQYIEFYNCLWLAIDNTLNSTTVCDWLLTIHWILQLAVIGYWQYTELYNCMWLAIDNTLNYTTVCDWLLTIHWIIQLSVIGYWQYTEFHNSVCDWLLTIHWIIKLSVIGNWQYTEFHNWLWLAIDNTLYWVPYLYTIILCRIFFFYIYIFFWGGGVTMKTDPRQLDQIYPVFLCLLLLLPVQSLDTSSLLFEPWIPLPWQTTCACTALRQTHHWTHSPHHHHHVQCVPL